MIIILEIFNHILRYFVISIVCPEESVPPVLFPGDKFSDMFIITIFTWINCLTFNIYMIPK